MRGNCIAIDEAISGVCYYFMRLPRSLRSFAMTIWYPYNNAYKFAG
ncbi:RND transporter [Rickettsia felis]|nr:RND transporter [Rickettsia felis]